MVQTRSHYAQYFFFNKLMKIGLVLVPTPDWWRERPVGTSTNADQKVLIHPSSGACDYLVRYCVGCNVLT